MRFYILIACPALALLLVSCTAMPAYRLLSSAPHKDVIHCLVFLPERASAETYQRIALEEVTRIRAGKAHRQFPLYEISFEFYKESSAGEILAHVTVVLDGRLNITDSLFTTPPKVETVVY